MPISPNQGPKTGGTTVTITGTNLSDVISVHFGVVSVSPISNTPTSVTVQSPIGSGTVPLNVTTIGGTSNSLLFTYIEPAVLFQIVSNTGSVFGGNTVTITGANLFTSSVVNFDSNSVVPMVINDNTINVLVPPGVVGTVPVTVTTIGGVATGLSYTYVDTPVVLQVTPNNGPVSGGTIVLIEGTELLTAKNVTFGGISAQFAVFDNTSVAAITPAGPILGGIVDVVVTTDGGVAASVGGFTYTL